MFKSEKLASVQDVRHAFFGREGGVSYGKFASLNISSTSEDSPVKVMENRRRVCARFDLKPAELFLPKQVHGKTILRVDSRSNPKEVETIEADALFTTEPGLLIGVQTADCAPLLLTDKLARGVMAVHLGWRGVACGLTEASVRFYCNETGATPKDIVAAIGPCIGFDAFEVKQEVVDALTAQVSAEELVREVDDVHFVVDLAGWIERILQKEGVHEIDKFGLCTVIEKDRFFSYRRDNGRTGRQVSIIMKA